MSVRQARRYSHRKLLILPTDALLNLTDTTSCLPSDRWWETHKHTVFLVSGVNPDWGGGEEAEPLYRHDSLVVPVLLVFLEGPLYLGPLGLLESPDGGTQTDMRINNNVEDKQTHM